MRDRIIILFSFIILIILCGCSEAKSAANYELADTHPVEGRQGICTEDGSYWVSGSTTLEKYDSNWNLVAKNTAPFEGYDLEVNHIGDIDVYNNELYLGVEYFMDGEGKNIQVAVYDGDTLKLKRVFPFRSDTGQLECSGIAVDSDSRTVYMTSWIDDGYSEEIHEVYVYDIIDFTTSAAEVSRFHTITGGNDAIDAYGGVCHGPWYQLYGNSIVIVEKDSLFYMLHGDITYMDEALYENRVSVVLEDISAARETLDRVREFVSDHPTVYCGTHTPQGYENLEANRVIDLNDPVPTVFAEVDFSAYEASGKYVCSICGYVYDPAEHDGVAFEELPDDWECPRCKKTNEKFNRA